MQSSAAPNLETRLHVTVVVRTKARGRFFADLGDFGSHTCLPLTIRAKGSKGDGAKIVIQPPPGTEIPCPI